MLWMAVHSTINLRFSEEDTDNKSFRAFILLSYEKYILEEMHGASHYMLSWRGGKHKFGAQKNSEITLVNLELEVIEASALSPSIFG